MPRLDLFLFGYFRISVDVSDKAIASDILLKHKVSAKFKKNGEFIIPYRTLEKVKEIFGEKVKYSVSEPQGFFGALVKYKKRVGIFLGIIAAVIIVGVSSDFVWDVRIDGLSEDEAGEIRRELSLAGLDVGKRWSKLDKNHIEINMLNLSTRVGWININRRGTVAYVKISEKTLYQEDDVKDGYANLVAARDCVIEDITVKSGYAMVKKGESVRAGEILISGVIPTELGGGFCYADGEVTGRYSESVSVTVSRSVYEKVYSETCLSECNINFFGKHINIFKKYGQFDREYDIIEKKEDVSFIKKLPICINKIYFSYYETKVTELSDDELILLASERLRSELLLFLKNKDARRMVTSGEFTADGYKMTCDAVVLSDIVKIQNFKVEK